MLTPALSLCFNWHYLLFLGYSDGFQMSDSWWWMCNCHTWWTSWGILFLLVWDYTFCWGHRICASLFDVLNPCKVHPSHLPAHQPIFIWYILSYKLPHMPSSVVFWGQSLLSHLLFACNSNACETSGVYWWVHNCHTWQTIPGILPCSVQDYPYKQDCRTFPSLFNGSNLHLVGSLDLSHTLFLFTLCMYPHIPAWAYVLFSSLLVTGEGGAIKSTLHISS